MLPSNQIWQYFLGQEGTDTYFRSNRENAWKRLLILRNP